MKNILLSLLFFSFTSTLFCQENLDWRKSYKGKIEIEKTSNDFIFFRVSSKWGVYNTRLSKIVLKPSADFVYADQTSILNEVFFLVKKGKIGICNSNGQLILKPMHRKLGIFSGYDRYSDVQFIQIDEKIYPLNSLDSINTAIGKGTVKAQPYLNRYNCHLEIRNDNDLLLINNTASESEEMPIYTFLGDDSIDVNGNLVYAQSQQYTYSGIYSIKEQVWKSDSTLQSIHATDNLFVGTIFSNNQSEYFVLDKSFNTLKQYDNYEKLSQDLAIVKLLIGTGVDAIDEIQNDYLFYDWFYYRQNGKAGLFSLLNLKPILPATHEELFFMSGEFYLHPIALVNKKFKINFLTGKVSSQFPACDSIFAFGFSNYTDNSYSGGRFLQLNDKTYLVKQETDTLIFTETKINKSNHNLAWQDEFRYKDDLVFVNSFVEAGPEPTQPIMSIDEFGNVYDSILGYDANGNGIYAYPPRIPSVNKSGLYNTMSKKWVLNREFTSINQGENGYVGVLKSEESHVPTRFSFVDNNLQLVFDKITLDDIRNNKNYLSKITGSENVQYLSSVRIMDYSVLFNKEYSIVQVNGKEGLFNAETMNWHIQPKYDKIYFSNNLNVYLVCNDKKIGLINQYGEVIVPPIANKIYALPNYDVFVVDDSLVTNTVTDDNSKIRISLSALVDDAPKEAFEFPGRGAIHFQAETNNNSLFVSDWMFESEFMEVDEFGEIINREPDPLTMTKSYSFRYSFDDKNIQDLSNYTQLELAGDKFLAMGKDGLKSLYNLHGVRLNEGISETKVDGDFIYVIDKNKPFQFGEANNYEYDFVYYPYTEQNVLNLYSDEKLISWTPGHELLCAFSENLLLTFRINENLGYTMPEYYFLIKNNGEWEESRIYSSSEIITVQKFNDTYQIFNYNLVGDSVNLVLVTANNTKLDTIANFSTYKMNGNYSVFDQYGEMAVLPAQNEFILYNSKGKTLFSLDKNEGSIGRYAHDRFVIRTKDGLKISNAKGELLNTNSYDLITAPWFFPPNSADIKSLMFLAVKGNKRELLDHNAKVIKSFGEGTEFVSFASDYENRKSTFFDGKYYYLVDSKSGVPNFSNDKKWDTILHFNMTNLDYSIKSFSFLSNNEECHIYNINGKSIVSLPTKSKIDLTKFYQDYYFIYNPGTNSYNVFDAKTEKLITINHKKEYSLSSASDKNFEEYYAFKEGKKYGISKLTIDHLSNFSSTIITEAIYDTLIKTPGLIVAKSGTNYSLFNSNKQYEKMNEVYTDLTIVENFLIMKKNNQTVLMHFEIYPDSLFIMETDLKVSPKIQVSKYSGGVACILHYNNKVGCWIPGTGFYLPIENRKIELDFPDAGFYTTDENVYRIQDKSKVFDETVKNVKRVKSYIVAENREGKFFIYNYNSPELLIRKIDYSFIDYEETDPVFIAKNNSKYGLIKWQELSPITAFDYDLIYSIYTGDTVYYAYKKSGKTGLLGTGYKPLTAPIYDSISSFNYSVPANLVVWKDKSKGLLSPNGKVLLQPIYYEFTYYENGDDKPSFYITELFNKEKEEFSYGIADAKGKVLFTPQFRNCDYVNSDDRLCNVRKGNTWYYIHPKTFKLVLEP